jgi:ubiquitin-large subunit ribosomal protein L40e
MPIIVSRCTGQSVHIEISSGDSIAELRKLSGATMRLIFCGQNLIDCKTLADYNIQRDSTIHEVFGMRVGGGSAEEHKAAELKAENCPICLDKMTLDSVTLPCLGEYSRDNKHEFHRTCVDKYISLKMATGSTVTCPLCKAKLSA